MTNKKKAPSNTSFDMPGEEIKRESLPNGDPYFEVTVGYSSIKFTSTYSQKFLSNVLVVWLSAFYDAVSTGDSLQDTPFKNFKIKLHPNENKKDIEEVNNVISFYTLRASQMFEHALPLKLADFTEQLLTEVIISIVLDMEEGGVFTIEGGRIETWDAYLTNLKRVLKSRWNPTISRGPKFWNPSKRAVLLNLYEWAFIRLQFWQHTFHKSGKAKHKRLTIRDWKEAKQLWPSLVSYLQKLPNETPYQLALEYSMEKMRFRSEAYLRKQLTIARKEREQSSEK